MHDDGRAPTSLDLYQYLIRLPPLPRIVAGTIAIAGGSVATLLLWGMGIIWGLMIFAIVAGFILLVSGLFGLRRQRKREAQLRRVEEKKEDLLREMIEARNKGYNPIRWLNDQGILDGEIRTMLLDAMNARLKPGPTAKP